ARRIEDGRQHAAAADVDAAGHQAVVRRFAAGACPRRQPAARGRQGLGAQAAGGGAMSYREYVIAAYAVFAAVLAWDYIAGRLAARRDSRAAANTTELQR